DQEQAPTSTEEPMAEAAPPDAAAIAAIEATLSHISPIKADSNLLWIDLSSAFPRLEEQQILDLLRPVAPNVVELTLSRCSVTDEVASVAAQMPRLQRLNLHGTDVTDATVLALAHHPALRELILTQTKVSDAAIQSLLEMPALEQVYLWESQVSPEGLAMLQEGQEGLLADAGAERESDVLVVEPEPKLIDAAVAGAAAPTGATVAGGPSLDPVNTVCPVSDKPVDPRFLVVHEGRVIGFCCSNCPSQFWADPATYVAKLKQRSLRGRQGVHGDLYHTFQLRPACAAGRLDGESPDCRHQEPRQALGVGTGGEISLGDCLLQPLAHGPLRPRPASGEVASNHLCG